MKIAIIGPGAMGCLFAGLLSEAGHEVWLLDRPGERADALSRDGIRLEGIGGTRDVPVHVATDPCAVGAVDLVMVWVKAYDTPEAARSLPPLLAGDTTVLSLQNGLGNLEAIERVVAPGRILGGVTTHGATLVSEGVSRHTGTGDTVLGSLAGATVPGRAPAVAEALGRAGIQTRVTQDLTRTLWSKLLVNATINPLTALTRLRNGDLPALPETGRLLHTVAQECQAVAQAAGVRLDYDSLEERVLTVCRATARNRSSMLQDLMRGRRTEIDAINGVVVARAAAIGQSAPLNELLVGLVKAAESAGMRPDPGSQEARTAAARAARIPALDRGDLAQ